MNLTVVTAVRNALATNRREALIRCIDSVAALKTPHEHLIYDAASTDGTVELLRELEARISSLTVVSEPDTGIYNALNKGVRDAKGEWFYVLGCDDYVMMPRVMERILRDNQTTCDEIVTPEKTYDGIRKITTDRIFRSTPYGHQGTIVRLSVIRHFGGFDERYHICADYDLMLKMHEANCRIKYINECFAYYDGQGVSFQEMGATFHEQAVISATHFHQTLERMLKIRAGSRPPMGVFLPYLFHKDRALRENARIGFFRSLLWPMVLARRMVKTRNR